MNDSVKELRTGLLKLDSPNYNSINNLMRSIMKKYDLTTKELHYGFRDKHNNQTPDEWIKTQRTKKMKTFREFLEESYLYEMRKEDKVSGKKKTPLTVPGKRSTIQRSPEGSKTKWQKITPDVGNPVVSMGIYRQGGMYGDILGYKRHAHGGAHGGMRKGSERGKKKQRGVKPGTNIINVNGKKKVTVGPTPETTPVQAFKSQKENNKRNTAGRYSKMFSDYNRPAPTRLDILRRKKEARDG